MVTKKLTFDDICRIEPEIKELFQLAKTLKEKKNTYEIWHRRFKPHLTMLVGERSKHPQLRTFEAYETAVDKIMKTLGV
jgi:2'-5' RNA ligase